MKTLEQFLEANGFVSAEDIDIPGMICDFIGEMERGLAGEKSSLMMVPTFVGTHGRVPSGVKTAVLDAGGTNFRSAIVEFPPRITLRESRPMPGIKKEVGEEEFYEAFAAEVRRLRPHAARERFGWCFSYPAEATEGLDARLARWTKNIKAPAIVGQYVGKELLSRLGGGEVAVVNDTTATLLAAKATEGEQTYSSYIGFILGTGTNCAYVEKRENITKLSRVGGLGALGAAAGGSMIVNAESGNFDKIAQSAFDKNVDAKSAQPGQGRLEKMISGAYLGSIGLEMYRAAAREGMFSAGARAALGGLGSLETIDLDNFCAVCQAAGRENPLDAIFAAKEDSGLARRLGVRVFERAAALTAIHLAAFAIKSGAGEEASAPIAISADGSTWYKTRSVDFAHSVGLRLDEMLVRRRNIHYKITEKIEDAPMIGAAIAALI